MPEEIFTKTREISTTPKVRAMASVLQKELGYKTADEVYCEAIRRMYCELFDVVETKQIITDYE